MPKPYSDDLRERVIEAVVAGASRRKAAESFSLSASSAVRWLQRWRDTGSARAKLSGGSTSPLEEHVEWLLALGPDLNCSESRCCSPTATTNPTREWRPVIASGPKSAPAAAYESATS